MHLSNSFRARWLAVPVALALIIAACGGPGATPGTGTPGTGTPGTGTPGTGTPGTGTPGTGTPGTGTPGTSPGEQLGGSVSVIASWTGSEEESFRAMIEPWVQRTGVQVDYTGTRQMADQLTAAIQAGGTGLPDVAGIPGPGLAQDWYDAGELLALDFLGDEYMQETGALADLGVAEDGTLIGVFTKAAVKGLIWYNTAHYDGTASATYEELTAVDAAPAGSLWCNAFESGDASGWPGTDWIEDFVIRESGPEVYDQWQNGELAWTSPEIRSAFEHLAAAIENSAGGGTQINATNFGEVGNGLFSDPPDCKFVHQASFISDFFVDTSGASADQFDFFVMPDINEEFAGALTGGGDMFGMFNDTPQAQSLIEYLVTAEAQEIWASRGGFIAANTTVPSDAYAAESDQKAAEALARATAFRFDASDAMPGAMQSAFNSSMVELASNPGNIDTILENLDQIQADAY